MIKLVAADMDGTLLDSQKQLPPDFWQTFDRLKAKGVLFVVASGRTYPTLKRNFEPRAAEMTMICDNGGVIGVQNEPVYVSTIAPALRRELLEACEEIPDIHLAVSTPHTTYMLPYRQKPEEKRIIDLSFKDVKVVKDLYAIEDDVCQIAICDIRHPDKNAYPVLSKKFAGRLAVQTSGSWWMDVMNAGVSKGSALTRLQKMLGVTAEETMAFGDFDNDIQMLSVVGESYVMQNAPAHMFQYGKHTAPSCDEYGVTQVIRREILGDCI